MSRSPTPSSGADGPTRRARAPTITIDTSAVQRSPSRSSRIGAAGATTATTSTTGGATAIASDHELDHLSDDGRSVYGGSSDRTPMLKAHSTAPSTPTEQLRGSNSFDSRESRPTSPHNISSPTQWNHPGDFLAVPVQRSRGGSIDTEASGDSMGTSDVTYVNTASPSEAEPKAFGGGSSRGDTSHKFDGGERDAVVPDDEALLPDQGTEEDFQRENNPFAFTPGQMGKMFNPKSLGAFHALGGLAGLEKGLRSDRDAGLGGDEDRLNGSVSFRDATSTGSPSSENTAVEEAPMQLSHTGTNGNNNVTGSYSDRKRIFNDNRLPQPRQKNILELMWMAYNDKVLILLTVCAVIALALGIYQEVAQNTPEWIEGVAIIVAIVVVVLVGAINDFQKEKQFAKLNRKKDDRNVKVIRSGKTQEISVHDVFVGDVLMIEPGDILPVDGIMIKCHGVRCDESSATGESDVLKKTNADEVYRAIENHEPLKKLDPFMISGAKVTEGYGRMLVTATGIHSSMGKTMISLQEGSEATPLQMKLNKLAEYIAKIGSAAALLLFVVAFIKFLAQLPHNNKSPAQKGDEFLNILIVAVTIVVVAVPEGLPLAVTLSLAYATKRMLKDNNLVRVLRSCETMGNATTICSDKTGTLTQNVMTVVAGAIGTSSRFSNRAAAASNGQDASGNNNGNRDIQDDVDNVPAAEFVQSLCQAVKTLWKDSIVINSTAFETDNGDEKQRFVGSKTETALLDFARDFLAMDNVSVERSNAEIVQMIPFDSGRKCMGMVVKMNNNDSKTPYRLLVKGASEIMLKYCNKIIRDPTKDVEGTNLSTDNRKTLASLIDAYASRSLRTIGFIYRDFEQWPPRGAKRMEDDKSQAVFADVCKEMTFLGLVGIQDPLRPGVPEAVKDCIMAGVFPRMVTGDNILTAKAIATECGIFTPGGVAIEGPEFRKMSEAEQTALIPKLQVLARSSPDDKRKLVKRLKEMGETVAVTGDGTNDAPALKAADVGFAMNLAGTEVAKEASDIILMDDNFTSIVLALMWGRAVNDSVRKFLQFQITVNITAVMLAFISAVASSKEESVLSAVQLLWVNLIMDTMAALALATDPPTRTVLNRKPDPKSAPLISVTMWKMIIGQAIYQLAVTLVLYFAGNSIFNISGTHETRELKTLIFNTFVWMQIFNALNNRRLDNRFNIFEGLLNNWFFIGIFLIMIGGQVLIIFVGGWPAFQAEHQPGTYWAIALILGVLSIPVGVIVRLVPDELAVRLVPGFIRSWSSRNRDRGLTVITDPENPHQNPFEFNQALYDIKDELSFIKRYKGGRLNNLRFAVQHPREAFMHSRSPSRSRASSSLPRTPENEIADGNTINDRSPAPSIAPSIAPSRAPSSQHQTLAPPQSSPTPGENGSRSRSRRGRSRSNSAFAGAAMAGIVAGSIAGGWSPIDRRDGDPDAPPFSSGTTAGASTLSAPAPSYGNARARSKSDLSKEIKFETHPQTSSEDPVVVPAEEQQRVADEASTAATGDGQAPPSQNNLTTPAFGEGPFGGQPVVNVDDHGTASRNEDGK